MLNTQAKHHTIGLVLLSLTAIFWGAGFVLNAQLLDKIFGDTPALLNAFRFVIATLFLLAIFNKKIRFNKDILLYGGVAGLFLFAGFMLQTIGQKYTAPSHSGFFTASYAMFVPFIVWIAYKKRPSWIMFLGVAVAIVGLIVLNFKQEEAYSNKMWLGDLLTTISAVMFALQIFWTDYSLKKGKVDVVQITFWQVAIAGILFVLYTVSVESRFYTAMNFDVSYGWWRLLIVVLGGTVLAYYSQSYAQGHNLSSTEVSLVLACESPIGAFLSLILAIEAFSWQTIVGGVLVILAVVLVEVIPGIVERKRKAPLPNACDPPSHNDTEPHKDETDKTSSDIEANRTK